MTVVAYLSNQFPSPVEPYVLEEICELRGRGIDVIQTSIRQPVNDPGRKLDSFVQETLYVLPLRIWQSTWATAYLIWKLPAIWSLIKRALYQGKEPLPKRIRALAHTWLGVYYATILRQKQVQHIHVHHGYFASWIAMTAAKLLGVSFSMTLHGSDVLLQGAFLEAKLDNCQFCFTISAFNRQYILKNYPTVSADKVIVSRLGVKIPASTIASIRTGSELQLLSVGRLHAVKNHAFLISACRKLKNDGAQLKCRIAGEGPERKFLQSLIADLDLRVEIELLGHLSHAELEEYYKHADLVVLTSRSEGIPLVLMEAMAREKLVLAPAITGIPELVIDGVTGFLYKPESINDFVTKLKTLTGGSSKLATVRTAARRYVAEHFDRKKAQAEFADRFLFQVVGSKTAVREQTIEDSLLQQIQLPI